VALKGLICTLKVTDYTNSVTVQSHILTGISQYMYYMRLLSISVWFNCMVLFTLEKLWN